MSPHLTSASPLPRSPPPISRPFRFKSKRPRSPSPSTSEPSSNRPHKSSRHRHHHRSRRRHDPTTAPPSPPLLDPDTAFRESLFDALADDEGAAFWEGVYGQPIHTYSPYQPNSSQPAPEAPSELERMTDEEYTAHVRAKMWEKSHGYIVEERRRREEERARRKMEGKEQERGRGEWERGLEEVLGRREKRREKRVWRGVWEEYVKGWEELRRRAEITTAAAEAEKSKAATTNGEAEGGLDAEQSKPKPKLWKENTIPWPTRSGKLKDVNQESVEEFLLNAPQPEKEGEKVDLLAVLKVERVRWHPDKIQQRYGALGIDDGTRKGGTAVFQMVDSMWGEMRGKVDTGKGA
ncbi:hypothetical protein MMC30_003193 [Trapelia coarctata]|nr:hypothetical protein [Trapelia coarctata]